MTKSYVQAVVANLEAGMQPEVVLTNLKAVLERRGHTRLYGDVVKSIAIVLEQKAKAASVTVVVSKLSASESSQVQKLIAELGATEAARNVVVDPTIIGGAKVSHRSRQLDATHKTALYSLYESITK